MSDLPRAKSVPVAPNLAELAGRLNLDLTSLVHEALRDRMLRESAAAFTPRLEMVLLAAHADARQRGHSHVGTEHVFLAILLDQSSLPSQLLGEAGTSEDAIRRVEELLASEAYKRNLG